MMKLTRRTREIVGFSMLISAMSLCVAFIVLSVRKRSLWKALWLLVAAEGAVGTALLFCEKGSKRAVTKIEDSAEAVSDVAFDEDDELFDEAGSREAELRMRHVFCTEREEAAAPSLRREIPRDEEATEADFQ